MNIKITFRNCEPTIALENHINEQLHKVKDFLEHERSPVNLEIIVDANPIHAHHRVESRLHAPEYHIMAHDEGDEMYKVISDMIDKLYTELLRTKEKLVDRHKRSA